MSEEGEGVGTTGDLVYDGPMTETQTPTDVLAFDLDEERFGPQGADLEPQPNMIAREGVDRCACGSKYWEDDRCIDCGEHVTRVAEAAARVITEDAELLARLGGQGRHCAICGEHEGSTYVKPCCTPDQMIQG